MSAHEWEQTDDTGPGVACRRCKLWVKSPAGLDEDCVEMVDLPMSLLAALSDPPDDGAADPFCDGLGETREDAYREDAYREALQALVEGWTRCVFFVDDGPDRCGKHATHEYIDWEETQYLCDKHKKPFARKMLRGGVRTAEEVQRRMHELPGAPALRAAIALLKGSS